MHVLILFAHPRRRSFTGELADAFCRGLEAAGHTLEFADLYAEGFDPVLAAGQFDLETALDPGAPRPADVQAEQARLDRAEGLVCIYPFWWSDLPALLKGWFDRVWSYGYAYAYQPGGERSTRLAIRKARALCPAGHTRREYTFGADPPCPGRHSRGVRRVQGHLQGPDRQQQHQLPAVQNH